MAAYIVQVAVTITYNQFVTVSASTSQTDAQQQAMASSAQNIALGSINGNGVTGARATALAVYSGTQARPDSAQAVLTGNNINQISFGTVV